MGSSIEIPDVVSNKAVAAGSKAWLDELPDLVASIERTWGLEVGRPFDDATEAFVAAATLTGNGIPVVLKLVVPRAGNAAGLEIAALRLAGGEGCVELLRSDESIGALLLERLGPSLFELKMPIGRRHEILCEAAMRIWRPAAGLGFTTGASKARWLVERITRSWEELDRPCTERAVAHAIRCARRRELAHDDERAVLVHGDVHEWNALRSGTGEFKLVDPDGLLAEAEYDLGIIMREDPVELLGGDPWERARRLAARTGCDTTAIWEWGVVERVSTGLLATEIELQPVGREMLRTADRIAAMPG